MRIVRLLVATVLATCSPAWGAGLSADRNAGAEAEIKALEMKLSQLLVAHKFDEYEKYLGADYTRIGDDGKVETRQEVLAAFRASSASFSMEPSDLDVKVYGDTAILTGKLKSTDASGTHQWRFRKVFIHRDSRWFLVSLQGIPLQD